MFTKYDLKENDWVVLSGNIICRVVKFENSLVLVSQDYVYHLNPFTDEIITTGGIYTICPRAEKVIRPLKSRHLTYEHFHEGKVVFDSDKGIGCEPTPKFKVEDYVKVIDPNKAFVLYRDFINENAPKLTDNFIKWGEPNTFSKFIVEAVAKHPDKGCFTYVIKDIHSLQAFVISEDGLEKIE